MPEGGAILHPHARAGTEVDRIAFLRHTSYRGFRRGGVSKVTELRAICHVRAATLHERIGVLTANGRVVKIDGGYRLAAD